MTTTITRHRSDLATALGGLAVLLTAAAAAAPTTKTQTVDGRGITFEAPGVVEAGGPRVVRCGGPS